METTEDILKEFEDFAARQETNPHFTLRFKKDQFGKETLNLKLPKIPKQKIIPLIILLVFLIPFTYIVGYFMLLFYPGVLLLFFLDTVFEIDKDIIAKKTLLFNKFILSKKEINCNELDRFEVVRKEYSDENGEKVYYHLIALFKNENKLEIYEGIDPALVNALDSVIEKFLGIEDESNESQLLEIKKSLTQVAFEKGIQQTKTNVGTSKPSKSFPFEINSNLIKDDIIYFSNFNHKRSGIFLVISGAFLTFGSCFVFSPIGIPLFLWGLRKLINKQYVNVTQQKIVYFTKPISIKKQKELLKSRIAKVEVVESGMTTNGVMSYHLVAISKDKSKHKLIRHCFNAPAMVEICKIINKRLGLV